MYSTYMCLFIYNICLSLSLSFSINVYIYIYIYIYTHTTNNTINYNINIHEASARYVVALDGGEQKEIDRCIDNTNRNSNMPSPLLRVSISEGFTQANS